MRIEWVKAEAFGPFQNAMIEPAPQLTVVYGPNEAGKSSWHAAIYAALCGLPKVKGQPKKEVRLFASKHKPWRGGAWVVRALVTLDNGLRRVELYQDLVDLASCKATNSGFDISSEILNDNTPDGAKWLGLDRDSFLAVACVRQAEIQSVLDRAEDLRTHLERAATAVGAKHTTAEALGGLDAFKGNKVGVVKAGAVKPLNVANVRLLTAKTALQSARQQHSQWQEIQNSALHKRVQADEAKRKLDGLLALAAIKRAEECQAKLNRAKELNAKLNAKSLTEPRPPLEEQDALSKEVAAALVLWESRSSVTIPTGRTAAEIRAEIDALPATPLENLTEEALDARLRELHRRLSDAARTSKMRPVSVGAMLLLVATGVVAWVWLGPVAGFALVFAGVVGLVWLALGASNSGGARILDEIRTLETARGERAERTRKRDALQQELAERGGAEQAARDSAARLSALEQKIIEIATVRCGLRASSGSEAAEQLCRWQQQHTESLKKFGAQMQERAELTALLGGGSLADLESQVRELEHKAQELRAGFDRLPEFPAGADIAAEIDEQLRRTGDLDKQATAAEARADTLANTIPSLVEAEEEVSLAQAKLDRVKCLEKTLNLTIEFLSNAQQRVQREIAPRLEESLKKRFAQVTRGRYTEAKIDPADLKVQVKDAADQWRDVQQLSHGTTEQVYLLLRIALAEYLAVSGEKCPVILDDVLVQCDRVRKRALLDTLRVVSRDHQVILFTQEDEVLDWARDHLDSQDRLVLLPEPEHPMTETRPVDLALVE